MDKVKKKCLWRVIVLCVLSFPLIVSQAAAETGQVIEAIGKLEQEYDKDRLHCVPDPQGVDALLRAIDQTTSEVERIRGMRWLSTVPFWSASIPKREYWSTFLKFSESSQPYALRYYTGIAMLMEKDELIASLLAEDLDRAKQFLTWNEEANIVYADLARLAIAQFIVWSNEEVAISQQADFVAAFQPVNDILQDVFSGSEAQEFLKPTSIIQDVSLARNIFEILSEGSDEAAWIKLIADLGLEVSSAFDPALGIGQVNARFLNPGRTVADTVFGRQARLCESTRQRLNSSNNKFLRLARGQRNRIINPVYAIDQICRSFTQDSTIGTVINDVTNAQNRDYRVVVGHTRGDVVRFSKLSPDELLNASRSLMENYPSIISAPRLETENYCISDAESDYFVRDYGVYRFQASEGDEGYIYIGKGLSRIEAQRLSNYVQDNRAFRGAYVFRPVDRR